MSSGQLQPESPFEGMEVTPWNAPTEMSITGSTSSLPNDRPAGPVVHNVAVIGKPNSGKSTLFTALSGIRVQTGNYPGVTVERKIGQVTHQGIRFHLIDVPGTYSLTPRSADEQVTIDILQHGDAKLGPIDVIACVVDATQLERGLFLISQLQELGRPLVVALNMHDISASRGVEIDVDMLSRELGGISVIPTAAHRREGITQLLDAIVAASSNLHNVIASSPTSGTTSEVPSSTSPPTPALTNTTDRYAWAERLAASATRETRLRHSRTDRIDRILTGRFSGLVVFAVLMFLIFQTLFTWVSPVMELCDAAQSAVSDVVASVIATGPLQSLLIDGVVAGVGGVLVFVPQIAILFLLIGLLEDSGYMARAALVTDRLMSPFGLSGKSFLPLLSSFACAVPGIMATRVIDNRRDRMITILVAPLMSCSARLPVYLLLIAGFVPASMYLGGWVSLQGLVLLAMLALGGIIAIPIAWLLGRTFFRGESGSFLLELPDYKWPSPRTVLWRTYDRTKEFVVRAGTMIFATSILIWAAGYFPGDHTERLRLEAELATVVEQRDALAPPEDEVSPVVTSSPSDGSTSTTDSETTTVSPKLASLEQRVADLQDQVNIERRKLIEESYLGRVGHWIEPVVEPCGWDWRIGTAVVASFPAREVVIATLGTIFSLGGDVDEEDTRLRSSLANARRRDGSPLFTLPVALSVMVFFALCAQCVSTLAIIRRETASWRWPIFSFVYMTALAYVAAIATFQIGHYLGS